MRIFLSFLQSDVEHTSVPPYGFWEKYLKHSIQEEGYEWVEAPDVDWAEGLTYNHGDDELGLWKDRTWTRAVDVIEAEHEKDEIDFFLSYLFPKQVEPSAIREIQALGIPCVNFFCDHVRQLTRVPESFHCFDLHWVPEFKALEMYEEAGLNHVHAPMPCWIPPEQRRCDREENYEPTFIGSRDALRASLFAKALEKGGEIMLRGPAWTEKNENGWEDSQSLSSITKKIGRQIKLVRENGFSALYNKLSYRFRPSIDESVFEGNVSEGVFGEEYVRMTQQSEITIGVNRYPSLWNSFQNPDTYSRLRDIEAPMMGACYLTEWTEGLEKLYKIGEEIETYQTADELVHKLEELKEHPEKRRRMRCSAQERALSDHTVGSSIRSIADTLELSV